MTPHQAIAPLIATHGAGLITSWLTEFGYPANETGLLDAICERGDERVGRELDIHGKRRAERAQMGPQRMQGRAAVIR